MATKPRSIEEMLEPMFVGVGGPQLTGEAVDVEIEEPGGIAVDGAILFENEDGSVEIDMDPAGELAEEVAHDANLAEYLDDSVLAGLASQLIQDVENDRESRADWEATMNRGIEQMGLKFEERMVPFAGACGVFDPLMAEAVIRWQAVARGELMPAAGPVKTEVTGVPTEELEAQASRVKEWMNLYLTDLAPEYYEEFDQMLMWLPLVGSTFKKIYQDPILKRPVARFITPDNFIVSYWTTDLATSSRFTHIIPMSLKQLKLAQASGMYRRVELGEPQGVDEDSPIRDGVDAAQGTRPVADRPEEYRLLEVYVDLDLKGYEHEDGIPLPYVVTIDEGTQKVLALRRNWKEGDDSYAKCEYFVHYKLNPGFGFYGLGYAHILGNSAKTATSIRRQLIDAGTLNNFPGGLRVKGMRLEDNNIGIGPTEFREIDTGGMPIQNAIMPMPYKEPSAVSLQLLQETYEGARNLASTTEIAVGEGRQDAPVGTTVALMEAATRVQSATLKRSHSALARELKMIANLFGEYLPDEPYPFPVRGGMKAIMRQDFSSNVDVIPVSDPNISSSAQRMMRAEALLRFATQQPDQHDMREAYKQMYVEMGIDPMKIDLILPNRDAQVQPSDPLTENMRAIMQEPIKAAEYQDHDAHIAAHAPIAGENPALQAHINEHLAFKMRVQVQMVLQQQLPPAGEKLPPELENQLAIMVAQAMEKLAPMYKPQDEQVDPYVEVEKAKIEGKVMVEGMKDATKRLEIQAEVESENEDRALKREIEGLKIVSEAQKNAEQGNRNG